MCWDKHGMKEVDKILDCLTILDPCLAWSLLPLLLNELKHQLLSVYYAVYVGLHRLEFN